MSDKVQVLHVDDSSFDRELVREALEHARGGFELVEASNREELESALAAGCFDVVLSDFNILGLDGLEVFARVRKRDPEVPVIIVTGTGSEETAVEAMKLGVEDYVIKTPAHIRRLPITILAVLEKRRLREERRQAALDLEKTSRLLATVLDTTHMLVAFLDPEFNFIWVNRAYASADGREPEFFPGRNHFALYPDEENKRIFERVRDTGVAYATGAKPFQYAHAPQRGTSYWDWSLQPVTGAAGRLEGLVLTLAETTDRVRMEKQLRESEERFRLLYEQAPLGYQSLDEEGRILIVNRAWSEVLGYRQEEVIGKWFGSLLAPESVPEFERNFPCFKKCGEIDGVFFNMRRRDGTFLPCVFHGRVGRHPNGDFLQTHCILHDVSEQLRDEARRRLSEQRAVSLLELSQRQWPDMRELCEFAMEEVVRLSGSEVGFFHFLEDESHFRLFLWSENVYKECSINKDLHYPLEKAGCWADCVRQRRPVVYNDYQNAAERRGYPEGHFPVHRFLSVPVFDGDKIVVVVGVGNKKEPYDGEDVNQLSLYMASFWRIVEIQRARAELKAMNETLEKTVEHRTRELLEAHDKLLAQERLAAIGQVAGSVAHDLRNPLGVISNSLYFVDLVLPSEAESVRKHLAIMKREVERSTRIIQELLDFSAVRASSAERQRLGSLLDEILDSLAFSVPADIVLDRRYDPMLPEFSFDRGQMARVFRNILDNAVQAMPDGGVISVASRLLPEAVEVVVADTGNGIPAGNMEKIFEPLFSTKPYGIGLGLAIVRKLVDNHGGTIDVSSIPGSGATFTIRLPLVHTA